MKLTIREEYYEPSITYSQFQKDYKWALKKYPNTYRFYDRFDIECGTLETVDYVKRGSKWVEINSETKPFTGKWYMNSIDATPFFKNLGGTERVEYCSTRYGIIPCKIISISPDRQERTIRTYTFNKEIGF